MFPFSAMLALLTVVYAAKFDGKALFFLNFTANT